MSIKANKKSQDRAREFVTKFYDKYINSRRYVSLTIHQYKNLKFIITNVAGTQKSVLFRDGAEEYSYWLPREERQHLVVEMMKSGMRACLIAKMMKFSPGTIYSDVAYLRLNTTLLDSVPRRMQPRAWRAGKTRMFPRDGLSQPHATLQ